MTSGWGTTSTDDPYFLVVQNESIGHKWGNVGGMSSVKTLGTIAHSSSVFFVRPHKCIWNLVEHL